MYDLRERTLRNSGPVSSNEISWAWEIHTREKTIIRFLIITAIIAISVGVGSSLHSRSINSK